MRGLDRDARRILAGLRLLEAYDDAALSDADPDVVAGQVATVFAQFERLVTSTRAFYASLSLVLSRYDLGREDFQAFKAALIDYLQRFVDQIARTMPQIGELLRDIDPAPLLARANAGTRLVGLDGVQASRSTGLAEADWAGLRAWFLGTPGRPGDADEVRTLATRAMRALLVNLRRLATSTDREVSRYADLVRLARWFDDSDADQAAALWAAAFGLYPCRHLGFAADSDGDPAPATSSWWRAPVADVPVMLRTSDGCVLGVDLDRTAVRRAAGDVRPQAHQRMPSAHADVRTGPAHLSELRGGYGAWDTFLPWRALHLPRRRVLVLTT